MQPIQRGKPCICHFKDRYSYILNANDATKTININTQFGTYLPICFKNANHPLNAKCNANDCTLHTATANNIVMLTCTTHIKLMEWLNCRDTATMDIGQPKKCTRSPTNIVNEIAEIQSPNLIRLKCIWPRQVFWHSILGQMKWSKGNKNIRHYHQTEMKNK